MYSGDNVILFLLSVAMPVTAVLGPEDDFEEYYFYIGSLIEFAT